MLYKTVALPDRAAGPVLWIARRRRAAASSIEGIGAANIGGRRRSFGYERAA